MASALLLGGCATPLTVAKDSSRFARPLGLSTSEVLFLNYCSYGKAPKGPKPRFPRVDGAAVATAGMLHLTPETVQEKTESKRISLKYSEIRTLALRKQGFGCEIHIVTDDQIVNLWITRSMGRWDCDAAKVLLGLMTATGLSVVEAEQWYGLEGGGSMAPIYFGPIF